MKLKSLTLKQSILPSIIFIFLSTVFHCSAQTIISENFSTIIPPSLPTGWTNTFTSVPGTTPEGWKTISSTTDAFWNIIPDTPAHFQYAECTEHYHSGNNPAFLTSPSFSLAGATAPYLSYDYLFTGSHYLTFYEKAYVAISIDSGISWSYIDTIPSITHWTNRILNLSTFTGTTNCKIRFEYRDNSYPLLGMLVSNIRVFNAQPNDLSIIAITPHNSVQNYFPVTTPVTISGVVQNFGTTTIDSFSASYQVNISSIKTTNFTGISIPPMSTYTFTCIQPDTITGLNTKALKLWVTTPSDPILTNDTISTYLTGISHFPTKKIVIEQATGTWCGNCPEGIIYMDSLHSVVNDNASFVSVHHDIGTGEVMSLTDYSTWIGSNVSSYPTVIIDRKTHDDPSNLQNLYNHHHNDFGYADIVIAPEILGGNVTIPVTINPVTQLTGVFNLAVILTENKVHNDSIVINWAQENNYSGGGMGAMFNSQYNFSTLPNPVTSDLMYYNFVARNISPSINGASGILPDTLIAGTHYTHTFTIPLPTTLPPYGWNTNYLNAIVLLIDSATGYILNSQTVPLNPTVGIRKPNKGNELLKLYPNPSKDQVKITFTLPEGTESGELTIYYTNGQKMKSYIVDNRFGFIMVDNSQFAAGMYYYNILANGVVISTQKMVVIK